MRTSTFLVLVTTAVFTVPATLYGFTDPPRPDGYRTLQERSLDGPEARREAEYWEAADGRQEGATRIGFSTGRPEDSLVDLDFPGLDLDTYPEPRGGVLVEPVDLFCTPRLLKSCVRATHHPEITVPEE